MFGRSADLATATFEERFEPDGERYLFRPKPTAHPVRVHKAELRQCVDAYRRGYRWLVMSAVALAFGMIALAVALRVDMNNFAIEGLGVAAIIGAYVYVIHWILWTAPERVFADRAPAGPGLTREEARSRKLDSIEWSSLALAAIVVVAFVGFRWYDASRTGDATWPWILIGTGFAVLVVVQSVRKMLHRQKR